MSVNIDEFVDYLPYLFHFKHPHQIVHCFYDENKDRVSIWVDEGKVGDESCLLEKQFTSHIPFHDYSFKKSTTPAYKDALSGIRSKIKAYHSFWELTEKDALHKHELVQFRDKNIFYYPQLIHTYFGQALKNIFSNFPLASCMHHTPLAGATVFWWNEKGSDLGPIPMWNMVRSKKIEKEDGCLYKVLDVNDGSPYAPTERILVLKTAKGTYRVLVQLYETPAEVTKQFRTVTTKGKIEILYMALRRFCGDIGLALTDEKLLPEKPSFLTLPAYCIWEMLEWDCEGNTSPEAALIRSSNVCFIDLEEIQGQSDTLAACSPPLFILAHTHNRLPQKNEQLSFSF